jgi:3-oxoacyl-[acyl-carrier-protein] synthase-3
LDAENIPFGTFAKNVDFRRDIGIEEVHVTDEMPSEVAVKTAKNVISKSGISGSEIDLIIDFTVFLRLHRSRHGRRPAC